MATVQPTLAKEAHEYRINALRGGPVGGRGGSTVVALPGKDRRPPVLVTVALAAFAMPIWWNLILRWTGATGAFSRDLPFRPFPVSWQDTGSGVFTLAGAAIALTLGVCAKESAEHVGRTALWTAVGAFLIDIYTY